MFDIPVAVLSGMCGDVNLYLNDVDDHARAEIEVKISPVSPGSQSPPFT